MTTATPASGTRTINVIRTEVEKSGHRGGRPWTLYRVYAEDLDGNPINEPLKTFDALPIGHVEVKWEQYIKDGAVESLSLSATTPRRANGQERKTPSPLERRVEALETEVAELRSLFTAAIKSVQED